MPRDHHAMCVIWFNDAFLKITLEFIKPFHCGGYFCPKHNEAKIFENPSKPGHVGIHWTALAVHSQMSTYMPGFQSFFSLFASYYIGQISSQQHKD